MIKCKYCEREFSNKKAYYAHKCEGYVNERKLIKEQKEKENNEGTYICNGCGRHFKTSGSLRSHARFCENYVPLKKYDENGKYISNSKYKINDNEYKCECGKIFDNFQSLNAHLSHCDFHHTVIGTEKKLRPHEKEHCMAGWENKEIKEIEEIHKKSGKTLSKRLQSGEIINHWIGKHHKPETLEKKRKIAIAYREKMIKGCRAAYNVNACKYIDKLNEEKGWNLQHALNGGEIKLFGYYVDGYDKERNIVFEYDEPKHYSNIRDNILKEKDIERQEYIISKLNCEFYRYNEKLDLFYKIEKSRPV